MAGDEREWKAEQQVMLFSAVLEGDMGGLLASASLLGRGLRCAWPGIRVRGHGLRSSGRLSHHVCKGAEELDSYGTFLTKLNKDSWKDCKLLDCWVSLAPQWKQRGRVQVAGDINPKRCKYLSGGQDRGKKVNQCVQWLHRRGKTTNVFSKLWRGRFWKCFSKLRLVNGNY